MSKTTDIGWTDSTASPWFGCTEVSPACLNCYARTLTEHKFAFVHAGGDPLKSGVVRRAYFKAGFADWATRPVWGDKATRVLAKGFWKDAVKWDMEAAKAGRRLRVFPSLMDWLDDFPAGVVDQEGARYSRAQVLVKFLGVVHDTPNIEWLLLTKRIRQAFGSLMEAANLECNDLNMWLADWIHGKPPDNVTLGVSVEDQTRADQRREAFRAVPAARKFVSYEPALVPVNWEGWEFVDQIIFGGESGPNRRSCELEWERSTREFCQANGIAYFCKQDSALLPGQRGRLPDEAWSCKQLI